MADVLPEALRLQLGVALVAEGAPAALDEAKVGELGVTVLAPEASWVPVLVHRLDNPSNDELAAFSAARRKQHLENNAPLNSGSG